MAKLFANIGDPDQTLRSVASDLGLHCFQITFLGVSRLQWVKKSRHSIFISLFIVFVVSLNNLNIYVFFSSNL